MICSHNIIREVKQELERIEQQRMRNAVRNEALTKKVQETLEANA